MSERTPVSRSRTRAAFADGATPNTNRECSCRSLTAVRSVVVLPAPAGPTASTSRSLPATAPATSACITSRPSTSTVSEGAGSGSWASIAQEMMKSSSPRMRSLVMCREVGATHTDRPSELRRGPAVSSGSRPMHPRITVSQTCSRVAAQRSPSCDGIGRLRSQTAFMMSARFQTEPSAVR